MILDTIMRFVLEAVEDDDFTAKDFYPGEEKLVEVNDPEWGRYNHDAIWTYQLDKRWRVGSTAKYPEISVGTPHTENVSAYGRAPGPDDPDPAIYTMLLKAVVTQAAGKGFDRVNFSKSSPRYHDAMNEAVDNLETQGLIKITGYSGAVIRADLLNRANRWLEALEDDELGDLSDLLGRFSVSAELQGDRIWKKVADNRWVFQENEHQRVELIRWEPDSWEIKVMFDEMTLTRTQGTETEALAILNKEGFLPGGGMHTREMKYHGFAEAMEDEAGEVQHRWNTSDQHRIAAKLEHSMEEMKNAGRPDLAEVFNVALTWMRDPTIPAIRGINGHSFVYSAISSWIPAIRKTEFNIQADDLEEATEWLKQFWSLREALEDEVGDVVYPNPEEELTIDQMKQVETTFFNRKNNRFFGTKKVYKYPGNYVVAKNVARHGYFDTTRFVIYKFTKTASTPQGLLLYKGTATDLDDAKKMIKTQDFRPLIDRMRDVVGEALEDEDDVVKDVGHPARIETLHIVGRNWWRRGYGGNYYTAEIFINGQLVGKTQEQGGSEQMYLYAAFDWLEHHGYLQRIRRQGKYGNSIESPREVAARMGFLLSTNDYEVKRERDL